MHFAEILTHLLREGDWRDDNAPVEAVDMGAGRGYLTFAAWQLLRRQLGRAARVTGIEARGELVRESMAIVERLGLEGLSFRRGAISEVPLRRIDILMALHACNTATDDAILRGVRAGARLLLVAPCCHQQIRPQLGRPDPVAQVLRHGIMAERLAEWLTDALRILFLQWAGYRVKAIEFVATEHTPKNLLLAGRLASRPFSDPEAEREIRRLKEFFGIAEHALDPLLAAGPPSPSASATAGNSWGRPGPEAA